MTQTCSYSKMSKFSLLLSSGNRYIELDASVLVCVYLAASLHVETGYSNQN